MTIKTIDDVKAFCLKMAQSAAETETVGTAVDSNKIADILSQAKQAVKKNWRVFEIYKNKIAACNIDHITYEQAMRDLSAILAL